MVNKTEKRSFSVKTTIFLSIEMHRKKQNFQTTSFQSEMEKESSYWHDKGQKLLKELINRKPINNHAKNVIMFLGDGMSLSTVAATRMYIGGEEMELSFEKFPYTGFSKVKNLSMCCKCQLFL